jgi:predicted  nucleic acid-binding Zn-ribbon protein
MKTFAWAGAVCLCANAAYGLRAQLSPITRVVELLDGLAKQAAKDGKKEEDQYETYVCWAKTVIDTKTATNEAAQSRIDELETYISDLDAGRIELTSERADLEKEIKDLFQELETMKAQREKEHEDFEAAEKEMTQAVDALDEAVEVLDEATADHKEGTLLQAKTEQTLGFAERSEQAAALQHAVELGERFLGKGDALFLRRVLTGEVPKADWKKLNRKATFKMAYKARSFKIQEVLAKMLDTFKTNRKDARDKEDESQSQYDELSGNKREQLESAQEALSKQDTEKGAAGMSKENAQTEVDALKTQVSNDEKFISQTATALENKKAEWKDRQALRTGEIAAINKAIGILHSDDARDMFKKSLSSQSFFLQLKSSKSMSAGELLKKAAKRTGDKRLATLAATVATPMATGSHFDQVITAIDDMISNLKGEEETDLENKEGCEHDRAEDTREAILLGRGMDDHTDSITEAENRIVEIKDQIKSNNAEIKSLNEELDQATKDREDEHTLWQGANSDDKAAADLVESAKGVLEDFYKDNDLMFLQNKKMDPVTAGEAPPPPPTTWEAPYGGKTGESQGIVAILEMIHEDILKDRQKAKDEEDAAKASYDDFKTDTEDQIGKLEDAISGLQDEQGQKESDIQDNVNGRLTKKNELETTLNKIADATPGCDYLTINYETKRKNRQIEIDGLIKAKAILEGGEFPSLLQGKNDAFLKRQ